MNKKYGYPFIFLMIICSVCGGCRENAKKVLNKKNHQLEIAGVDSSKLFVDKVANKSIMRPVDTALAKTNFITFKVGFESSLYQPDKSIQLKRSKYFQYDMFKDWKLLVDGDSLFPVFYEPRVKTHQELEELIIVFELQKGKNPSELVYVDSYGPWGVQIITLNKL